MVDINKTDKGGEETIDKPQQHYHLIIEKIKEQLLNKKMILIALIPIIVLGGMIVFLFNPAGQLLLQNSGNSLPEITIERIEFQDAKIVAFLRNTGSKDIAIAQADINDRIQPAAIEPGKTLSRLAIAKVIIPFSWNPGEPYEIGITTSDGIRFHKSIEAAVLTPTPNLEQVSFFAIIGTLVGVVPVMIGLLWFPFIKRLSTNKYIFFLSLTAGLLLFLGIDALVEASKIAAQDVAGVFNGQMLIAMVTIVAFLALLYISEKLVERAATTTSSVKSLKLLESSSSLASAADSRFEEEERKQHELQHRKRLSSSLFTIAFMIAISIGLHNLGEGLAIGAAVLLGNVAFGTFLIVGFTLHNTTEGLAIVAPIAKSNSKVRLRRLMMMGVIAGAPAIAGMWIGGFLYSPIAAIIFLSVGAGAIFQVIYCIMSWILNNSNDKNDIVNDDSNIKNRKGRKNVWLNPPLIAGFIVGMIIMYITSLMVSS
ncbi:MAG TPA: ZIP family metal transporter [Nitrososphaeraceae archaeon]